MTKRGFPIPDVLEPDAFRCATFQIPDDPLHIAAFWGHLYELSRWWSWERDDAHSGAVLAPYWRNIIDQARESFEAGECTLSDLLIRVEDCIVEWSIDGGSTWQLAGSLEKCVQETPRDTEGQPGEGDDTDEAVPGGECRDITLRIPANGQVLVPFVVEPGDKVRVTAWEGAWTSGRYAPVNLWYCGGAKLFYLGVCTGTDDANNGDILTGSKEHAIVARYGSHTFEANMSQHTIPDTESQASLTLEMNDSAKSDNDGSLVVTLEICKDYGDECEDPGYGQSHSDNLLTTFYGSLITASEAPIQQYPSGYWAFNPGAIITLTQPASGYPDRCVTRIADQFARFNVAAGLDVRVGNRAWLPVDMLTTPTNGTLGPQVGRDIEGTYFLTDGGTIQYRVTGAVLLINSVAFYYYNEAP